MAYPIEEKFVIAVASSALFNLEDSDKIFREQGEEVYRAHQRENETKVLDTGVAFPLIKRLLQINTGKDKPVEVVLLSRNDPDTGLRVFNSIEHYGLDISRAAFVTGDNPFKYMNAFNASLFLSGNKADVEQAVAMGLPAGCIQPTSFVDNDDDLELRLAFDFDGVIADDSAEKVYQSGGSTGGLESFHEHETLNALEPLPPGPLLRFFNELAKLQKKIKDSNQEKSASKPSIKIAIVTARNAPAHTRVVHTLRSLDIFVDEALFLGGVNKNNVLSVFKPHIFFDDQIGHINDVSGQFPSVHVPFGITNKESKEGGNNKSDGVGT